MPRAVAERLLPSFARLLAEVCSPTAERSKPRARQQPSGLLPPAGWQQQSGATSLAAWMVWMECRTCSRPSIAAGRMASWLSLSESCSQRARGENRKLAATSIATDHIGKLRPKQKLMPRPAPPPAVAFGPRTLAPGSDTLGQATAAPLRRGQGRRGTRRQSRLASRGRPRRVVQEGRGAAPRLAAAAACRESPAYRICPGRADLSQRREGADGRRELCEGIVDQVQIHQVLPRQPGPRPPPPPKSACGKTTGLQTRGPRGGPGPAACRCCAGAWRGGCAGGPGP